MSNHKDTKGKAKLRFIPYESLVAISNVREFGIKKYKDDQGWKTVSRDDFAEAALRHIHKYFNGQLLDDESELPHLHHALCSLALAVSVQEQQPIETKVVQKRRKIKETFPAISCDDSDSDWICHGDVCTFVSTSFDEEE